MWIILDICTISVQLSVCVNTPNATIIADDRPDLSVKTDFFFLLSFWVRWRRGLVRLEAALIYKVLFLSATSINSTQLKVRICSAVSSYKQVIEESALTNNLVGRYICLRVCWMKVWKGFKVVFVSLSRHQTLETGQNQARVIYRWLLRKKLGATRPVKYTIKHLLHVHSQWRRVKVNDQRQPGSLAPS